MISLTGCYSTSDCSSSNEVGNNIATEQECSTAGGSYFFTTTCTQLQASNG